MNWLTSPAHARWLDDEAHRLIDFAEVSRHPAGGFGFMRHDGTLDEDRDVELWITCRMTHVFAIAALMGRPGATTYVDHGLAALRGRLRDQEHGGWFAAVGADGPTNTQKEAYGHAFVVLAASSAKAAGRDGADELLAEALATHAEHFWDEDEGMCRESFNRDWSKEEQYRGINSSMHTVEAYLAAADVLGEPELLQRALRITERTVHVFAREHDWRLPEHFTVDWQPLLDYNLETPAHPFRPYGATIGHWFEWARLTVQLASSLRQSGLAVPQWMLTDARALFDAAVSQGWGADGKPGFTYTVDFDGVPVVRQRMHWVSAEAIAAAAVLWHETQGEGYADHYRQWWDFVAEYHLDPLGGSWWHELDSNNQVAHTVWEGKIDVYHALQATLYPRLPITPAIAPSLAANSLK